MKDITQIKLVNISECQKGDIILLNGNIQVVVDNGYTSRYLFVANPEEYISVEMSPHISYGRVGSGYENVSLDTTVKILGHIPLKSDTTEEEE